ncbi:MAG: DUF1819 family protein [Coriobacteriales bacterium]
MSKDYCLSMSGASARIPECLIAVREYLDCGDWNKVRRRIIEDNLFQLNAPSSRKRITSELVKRLRTLNDDEIRFLNESFGDDRNAIIWVSICRTYQFVRDVSEQLLADRYSRTIPDLSYEAYDAFFEEQSQIHPELSELTEMGYAKMRNVVFKMMRDCRLLTDDLVITPLHPTGAFRTALGSEHANDLQLFPGMMMK